jgi:hypothetical protein
MEKNGEINSSGISKLKRSPYETKSVNRERIRSAKRKKRMRFSAVGCKKLMQAPL